MKEYQRKITEGLKLLIDGLLDDTEDLRIFVKGAGEEKVLQFRMEEIKDYLTKAEKIDYFPIGDLQSLKLKYMCLNNRINRT